LGAVGEIAGRIVGALDEPDPAEPCCGTRNGSGFGLGVPFETKQAGDRQHGHAREEPNVLECARDAGASGNLIVGHTLEQVEAKSLDSKKLAEVMHSGKVFKTVLGDIAYDAKGDVSTSGSGYIVAGKKKDRYVLYVWKKGPDGKISYFEAE
jgi:hypothetical protein